MTTSKTFCLRSWIKACSLIAAAPTLAHAAAGDLDTSFASKGWITTAAGVLKDDANTAYAVIQQADGKLVAAGSDNNGTNTDFLLMRYSSSGALDTGFDGDGRVTTAPGSGADNAYALLQQSDGKLVAVGTSDIGTGSAIALVRYNSNGSLDSSFGSQGIVKTEVSAGKPNEARAIVQQPDGKLVVAGTAQIGTQTDIALVRFNTDGSLDSSFGSGGKTTASVLTNNDIAFALALQSDNKLVVAGTALNGIQTDIAVLRFTSSGSLDSSFDGDGKLTTAIGTDLTTLEQTDDYAYAVAQQADGKLVVSGSSNNGSNTDTLLVRYNTDGSLDTLFGTAGKVSTAIHSKNDEARAVSIQPDGKIVTAGYTSNGSNNDFAFARYSSSGILDLTFSLDGMTTLAVGNNNDAANAMALQQDGKIVAAGVARMTNDDFALARLDSSGNTDNSFDGDGKLTTTAGAAEAKAFDVLSQSDGKVVIAGQSLGSTTRTDVTVARYLSNGQLDTSFSSDGLNSLNGGATVSSFASSILQQADGKIVTAGYKQTTGSNKDLFLTRYNTDGSADTTFGGSGKSSGVFNTTNNDVANDVIQIKSGTNAGKLVIAGYVWSGTTSNTSDFAIAMLRVSGAIENNSFNGGRVSTNFSGNADIAYALTEQSDGKIVAVGSANNGTDTDIAVARYDATTGALDSNFGTAGKFVLDISTTDNIAYSVIQQSDGKLLIAGSSGSNILVMRLLTNGTLDTAFAGGSGYATFTAGSGQSAAFRVIEEKDGKLTIAATAIDSASNSMGALVRLQANGTLDTSFGAGGKALISTGASTPVAGMTIQADGKYLLAGNGTGPTSMLTMRVQTTDSDNDGLGDSVDNCPANANPAQENNDADSQGDTCDTDDDNDGVLDIDDAFPFNSAESQDSDVDGIGDNGDNCSALANSNQANLDVDTFGDACDGDIDGDGVSNGVDSDPLNNAINTEITLPLDQDYDGSGVKEHNSTD